MSEYPRSRLQCRHTLNVSRGIFSSEYSKLYDIAQLTSTHPLHSFNCISDTPPPPLSVIVLSQYLTREFWKMCTADKCSSSDVRARMNIKHCPMGKHHLPTVLGRVHPHPHRPGGSQGDGVVSSFSPFSIPLCINSSASSGGLEICSITSGAGSPYPGSNTVY